MKIFSTASVRFGGFDEGLPVPPDLWSDLTSSELKQYFEKFSYFVYQRRTLSPQSLGALIYENFIRQLVVNAAGVPAVEMGQLHNAFSGFLVQDKRCELALASPSETLPQLIVRRFGELKAGSDAYGAYLFQLWLYIALYHFFIWYHTEVIGEPVGANIYAGTDTTSAKYYPFTGNDDTNYFLNVEGSNVTMSQLSKLGEYELPDTGLSILHRLSRLSRPNPLVSPSPPDIRKYVTQYVTSSMKEMKVQIKAEFFESAEYNNALIIEGTAATLVSDRALGAVAKLEGGDYIYLERKRGRGKATDEDVKPVKQALIGSFRSALKQLAESHMSAPLHKFLAEDPQLGRALLEGYGNFSQYGLGDGSPTVAMFEIINYGLLFVPYKLDPDDFSVIPEIDEVPLLDPRDPPKAGVCFLFYGLDNTFNDPTFPGLARSDAPRIVFKPFTHNGKRISPPDYDFKAIAQGNCRFEVPTGFFAETVQLKDFTSGADVCTRLQLDLKTSTGGEELVYIVFKNNIENPRKTRLSLDLSTEWLNLNNEFWKSLSERQNQVLTENGVVKPDVAVLVRSLVNANIEIFADVAGLGVGSLLKPSAGDGAKVGQSDEQRDNRVPDHIAEENDFLRYAYGTVDYYPAAAGAGEDWLIFHVKGFVSRLRCTWETKLPPAQFNPLFNEVGQYLTVNAPEPRSYNCVLSSFRAFAMLAAMVEAIVRQAAAMVGTGPNAITQQQFSALRTQLENFVKLEAKVEIVERADAPAGEEGRKVTKTITDISGVHEVPVLVTWSLMQHFIPDFLQ